MPGLIAAGWQVVNGDVDQRFRGRVGPTSQFIRSGWHVGQANDYTASLKQKDNALSAQALECEERRSAELAESSFSGVILASGRSLKCASVSVRPLGPDGTPREIKASCDPAGFFMIPGFDLKASLKSRPDITQLTLGVGNPLTGETMPVSYATGRVTLRVLQVNAAPGGTDSVVVQA